MTTPTGRSARDRWILWLAEGFGSGRLKPGPGTWGSLVGVGWVFLLLWIGNPWIYTGAILASIPLAVIVCSAAERLLGRHDPASVVLDEIVAMPIAFAGYAVHWTLGTGQLPGPGEVRLWWPFLVVAFVLFRILDIWKPWPIRRLQCLPRGLGIVADDLAAGLLAGVLVWASVYVLFWWRLWRG